MTMPVGQSALPGSSILINKAIAETRMALVEAGRLAEIYFGNRLGEEQEQCLNGVFLGRVKSIDKSLDAAFVDIGLKRDGFLRAENAMVLRPPIKGTKSHQLKISDCVREGETVLVQVAAEPQNGKGARLTCDIAFAGQHVVFLPLHSGIKVSSRIKPQSKANQLAQTFERLLSESEGEIGRNGRAGGGFILRTQFEEQMQADLLTELQELDACWRGIEDVRPLARAPQRLDESSDWALKLCLDLLQHRPEQIVCDDVELYNQLQDKIGCDEGMRDIRLIYHKSATPIFEVYDIEEQLECGYGRLVPLKGGGQLAIDQTQAMTVVDVDSGASQNLSAQIGREDNVLRVNLEAALEIAYQLRLRAIGGLVVVDFIHMKSRAHQEKVVGALRAALGQDPCPCDMGGMSKFGIVELIRKRMRPSLLAQLGSAPYSMAPPLSFSTCTMNLCRALETELGRAPVVALKAALSADLHVWLEGDGQPIWRAFCAAFPIPIHLEPNSAFVRDQFEIHQ